MAHTKRRLPGAVVTGASRGIGAAIALRLSGLGYGVCVNFVTQADRAESVVEAIQREGGRALAVRADMRDFASVREMIGQTASAFGGIRAVVNNVGSSAHATLEAMTLEDWDEVIAVNLTSAFFAAKAAVPYLMREPWGRIIHIASLRAMTGSDHGAHYAAAKAGLIGLTKSLALELAPRITVNAVSPGYTRTDMTRAALEQGEEKIAARIPARRVAEPDEIAALVAFLAGEDAGYITGETINANGGIYMQ
jgi:3-oxoacyl-[acyl-carrier protein] reductase